jgi:hypothetical protein
VAIPSAPGSCNLIDGAGKISFCQGSMSQLPDPGNGFEGAEYQLSPMTFATPLGTDGWGVVGLPRGNEPTHEVLPVGVDLPWSYSFNLTSTDPAAQVSWNLDLEVDTTCQVYKVSVDGTGLGAFTGAGSMLTQERQTCLSSGDVSESTFSFGANVSSIEGGATLTLAADSLEINPLNAIPEPAAGWLFLTGLACLGFPAARKRQI